jgi:hypothetical protein
MQIKRTARTLLTAAALAGAAFILTPAPQAHAAVFISVGYAPPAIPVYEQPPIPGDGYIWTPGYWAWGPDGYYWVDGAWVLPPYEEALWTPGWWGFDDGAYVWYPGYWGPTVGYYGGINYGFGYFGTGFYGGYWNRGHFFYNTAYVHVGPGFHGGVYNRTYNGFSERPSGASFNAHPPAEFSHVNNAAGFHGSGVNGREAIHGTEALPNRGGNDNWSNRQQPGPADRGQQQNWNRAPLNGNQQPNPDRGGQSFGGGQQPNFNRGGQQPSYSRAPAAPAGNVNHTQSAPAPAPHQSAPSGGGGSRGGGEHGHR